jgi:hypothetical protein
MQCYVFMDILGAAVPPHCGAKLHRLSNGQEQGVREYALPKDI